MLLAVGNAVRIKGERKSKHMASLRRSLIFLPTGTERPTDFQTRDDVLVDAELKKRERPEREHRSLEANHSIWLHEWGVKKMRSLWKETSRYSWHHSPVFTFTLG